MSRPARSSPRERSESWPDVKSEDPSGEIARQFSVNLRDAIGALSLRAASVRTGVDHSTILSILQGRVWPDLDTIAKLERGLGVNLWPGMIAD